MEISISKCIVLGILAMLLAGPYASAQPRTGTKSYIIRMDSVSMPSIVRHVVTELLHVYNTTFHGFAALLTPSQLEVLQKLPGFLQMAEDKFLHTHTTRSPDFLSLNPSAGLWPQTNFGSNAIIGMVDTGVWPESASFRDTGLGPVPAKWKGACVPGARFTRLNCNKKLVGARYYFKGFEAMNGPIDWTNEFQSARDAQGHGTHTASTAAGSAVYNASMNGLARGTARGMAPNARLAAYKVCWGDGNCALSDVLAAIDQAVADGVDVVSISLAAGAQASYDADLFAVGAFGAMSKGVFVSAAAGNDGPNFFTVANSAPWIMTVAAGTLDRDFPASLILGSRVTLGGQSLYSGRGFYGRQIPLVYAGINSVCMPGSLDPRQVRGKIVLCENGVVSGVDKSKAVAAAGGAGMIVLMNLEDGKIISPESYVIPAIAVTYATGNALKNYIRATKFPTVTLNFFGTRLGIKPAPQVAPFSSRGPNPATPDVLKPDILAPGFNILAAWTGAAGPGGASDARRVAYNIISGTSMACPHISGIAALLKSAHPTWSPAAIKSAIMTSAYNTDNAGLPISDSRNSRPSNPFALGSGHVNPQRALSPGLVYDLTQQNYINYLCSQHYTVQQIRSIAQNQIPAASCPAVLPRSQDFNYPSLTAVFSSSVVGSVSTSFTRTVTNVGAANSVYVASVVAPTGLSVTVLPNRLVFSAVYQKLSFVVRVSASKPAASNFVSAALTWSDGVHIVRSPVTVLFN